MAIVAVVSATDHAQLMLLRQSAKQAGGGAYEGVSPTPPAQQSAKSTTKADKTPK